MIKIYQKKQHWQFTISPAASPNVRVCGGDCNQSANKSKLRNENQQFLVVPDENKSEKECSLDSYVSLSSIKNGGYFSLVTVKSRVANKDIIGTNKSTSEIRVSKQILLK